MKFRDCFFSALVSLRSNKLRSALTLLGVMIGVCAVVFVVSFGRGQQQSLTAIFDALGPTNIFVMGSTRQMMGGMRPAGTLTSIDVDALVNSSAASGILKIAPSNSGSFIVVYGNQIRTISVRGAVPEISEMSNYRVSRGDFITELDLKRHASVAVLGAQTAADFFGKEDPLYKRLRIGGRNFEVTGVLERRGGFGGPDGDNFIMIPYSTMEAKFMGEISPRGRPVSAIIIQAESIEAIPVAKAHITEVLRKTHHLRDDEEADFSIVDMQEILKRRQEMMFTFQIFLASTAVISLVVGGIGIMNIMLVSVNERIREIGICKAVGAKRGDLLKQFLVEAALLSLGGGILGLVMAIALALFATGKTMGSYVVAVPISPDIVLIAIIVSVVVGLVSGTYPAYKAARLDPVVSLRDG